MFFQAEFRGPEAIYCVTSRAFPCVGSLCKLPVMLVFMTVPAFLKSEGFFEIAIRMAKQAVNLQVLAL